MPKHKHKKPSNNKKRKSAVPAKDKLWLDQIATLLIGGSIFMLAWWGVDQSLNRFHLQLGTLTSGQVSQQNVYKSLDLGQAQRAHYFNKPIVISKDLGITDHIKHKLIRFGVPKDNLTEFALMTTPETPAPKQGYPVIILCHGYANPRTYSTTSAYLADMEFYSQHGFAVIKPDFRGQGLSLPDGSSDSAYYSMSYNTDVLSLIAAIEQTPELDKDQLSIWGHSMGGYIALRAAVLSPAIKHVILLSAPVGNISDMFSDYTAISDASNPIAASVRSDILTSYGTPLSNPKFWDKASPLTYLKDDKAYIQIHVGNDDTIVPPLFSAELDQALTKLNKPHGYFVYQGGTHGLVPERSIIWQRSLPILTDSPAT